MKLYGLIVGDIEGGKIGIVSDCDEALDRYLDPTYYHENEEKATILITKACNNPNNCKRIAKLFLGDNHEINWTDERKKLNVKS